MVRFKHRYLLCELVFPTCGSLDYLASEPTSTTAAVPSISESAIIHLLRDSLSVNFGDVGSGEVGGTFSVKYLSPSTSTLILRVSREHYRTLWASLTLLRKVGGHPVVTRVTHVSGTIRKIQHRAIALDREHILRSHRKRLVERLGPQRRPADSSVGRSGDVEEDEVEARLKDSRDKIMALEA
ncbi:hypothetical protein JCM11491_003116 [Sporobolomyces phaffii]